MLSDRWKAEHTLGWLKNSMRRLGCMLAVYPYLTNKDECQRLIDEEKSMIAFLIKEVEGLGGS